MRGMEKLAGLLDEFIKERDELEYLIIEEKRLTRLIASTAYEIREDAFRETYEKIAWRKKFAEIHVDHLRIKLSDILDEEALEEAVRTRRKILKSRRIRGLTSTD